MAPRSLRYARAAPRSLVSAPVAVSRADVAHAPPAGGACCFGTGYPAPPTERVPLSPLDTFLFVRMLTIPVAFFFATKVDEATLAASLSRALARFPLVAGNEARTAHASRAVWRTHQANTEPRPCLRHRRAAAACFVGAKDPVHRCRCCCHVVAQRRG
jgi:hypothetical protein